MLEAMPSDFTTVHNDWPVGLVLDDQLWYQAIQSSCSQEHRQNTSLVQNDRDLWRLLKIGLEDPQVEDRPMDASIRAMRFAAILGDRIQSNVERERARVSSGIRVLFIRLP